MVNKVLEEEIERAVEKMKNMKPEDPGYKSAAEAVATLQRARIDEEKLEFDDRKNGDELEFKYMERDAQVEVMKVEKRKFTIKCILDGAAIVVPAALYAFFGVKGFKFEQTGTFCSQTNKFNLGNIFKFRK